MPGTTHAQVPLDDATALRLAGLTKRYPSGFTLGPLDLAVNSGETVAILGKNGAGKSTLFEILTGNADASSGSVHVGPHRMAMDRPETKRLVGYMPQNPRLPKWVTPRDILTYAAGLHGISDPSRLLEHVTTYWDCRSYIDRPLAACSHGMAKRVALALATLHNPPVVVLDEPFETLDIVHVKALEAEIIRRERAGLISILSTHQAPYAARVSSRVLLIEEGRMRPLDNWTGASTMERVNLIEDAFAAMTSDMAHLELHPQSSRTYENPSR